MYNKFFKDNKELTQNIVYFFCSDFFGEAHENVVNKFIATQNNENNDYLSSPNWLSLKAVEQFIMFHSKFVTRGVAQTIIEELVSLKILLVSKVGNNLYYKGNYKLFQKLSNPNLVFNLIFEKSFMVDSNKPNVLKVETQSKLGDIGIGTGFLLSLKNGDEQIAVAVTCQHVASEVIKILDVNDKEYKFQTVHHHPTLDISVIELSEIVPSSVYFETEIEALDEVITIGFPTVPHTDDAYWV